VKDRKIANYTELTDYKTQLQYALEGVTTRHQFFDDKEQILKKVRTGTSQELREISRRFFRYTLYRRLVIYLGTLFKLPYVVTPIVNDWEEEEEVFSRLKSGIDFCEKINFQEKFTEITTKVVKDGVFFGYLRQRGSNYVIQDLPPEYCRSYYTINNRYAVEFNIVDFFRAMSRNTDEDKQRIILEQMPEEALDHFRKFQDRKVQTEWALLNPHNAMCFKLSEDEIPPLSGVIPDIMNLFDYKELELSKDRMELVKILVQKMPTNREGDLLFDPVEARQIHKDALNMIQQTRGVDVFTTFAEVDMVSLQEPHKVLRDNIGKGEKSTFTESGISKMLFATEGSASLEKSIQSDEAMMSVLLSQYGTWMENQFRRRYNTKNITLKMMVLPISWYNEERMLKMYSSLLSQGYSKIVPYVATGHKQQSLISLLELEKRMGISSLLEPPQSPYHVTNEGGRPSLDDDEKDPSTIEREERDDQEADADEE